MVSAVDVADTLTLIAALAARLAPSGSVRRSLAFVDGEAYEVLATLPGARAVVNVYASADREPHAIESVTVDVDGLHVSAQRSRPATVAECAALAQTGKALGATAERWAQLAQEVSP